MGSQESHYYPMHLEPPHTLLQLTALDALFLFQESDQALTFSQPVSVTPTDQRHVCVDLTCYVFSRV